MRGFTFLPTNSYRGKLAGYANLIALLAKLPFYRMAGYGMLHAHVAMGKSFVRKSIILAWARVLGFRTIYHCHSGGFRDYVAKVGKKRVTDVLHRCTAVAVLTEGWAEYFRKELECDPVTVINNPVEPALSPVEPRHYAGDRCLTVVFLGKLVKEKGLYELLDALREHHSAFAGKLKVRIAGMGDAKPFLEKIEADKTGDVVEFVGAVSGEAKDAFLRSADLVILPSYFEGLPVTLLEAGVYKIPSIATRVGGIPELIADGVTGTIIEPKDSDAIARALQLYLDNPGLIATQGEAASARVGAYMPEAVERQLHDLYKEVAARPR